mmetsp:Transcript_25670/g.75275  ORF Transcript_25670/g.75275 Transcript_25670/m.75275 type:complete len:329 (+) Transcript_25670:261-1247(+)
MRPSPSSQPCTPAKSPIAAGAKRPTASRSTPSRPASLVRPSACSGKRRLQNLTSPSTPRPRITPRRTSPCAWVMWVSPCATLYCTCSSPAASSSMRAEGRGTSAPSRAALLGRAAHTGPSAGPTTSRTSRALTTAIRPTRRPRPRRACAWALSLPFARTSRPSSGGTRAPLAHRRMAVFPARGRAPRAACPCVWRRRWRGSSAKCPTASSPGHPSTSATLTRLVRAPGTMAAGTARVATGAHPPFPASLRRPYGASHQAAAAASHRRGGGPRPRPTAATRRRVPMAAAPLRRSARRSWRSGRTCGRRSRTRLRLVSAQTGRWRPCGSS